MTGRPRPDELHKLHGEPGHRRSKRKGHLVKTAAFTATEPPSHLRRDAKAEWRRTLRDNGPLGTITRSDRALLMAWSTVVGDYIEAERALKKEGLIIGDTDEKKRRNPWLLIRNKAIETMRAIAVDFGFSPASRPRLGRAVSNPDLAPLRAGGDALDRYLDTDPDRPGSLDDFLEAQRRRRAKMRVQ